MFNKGADGATKAVDYMTPRWARFMVIYGLLIAVMVFGFTKVPTAFMPDEDQGSPDGSGNTASRSDLRDYASCDSKNAGIFHEN